MFAGIMCIKELKALIDGSHKEFYVWFG